MYVTPQRKKIWNPPQVTHTHSTHRAQTSPSSEPPPPDMNPVPPPFMNTLEQGVGTFPLSYL